MDSLLSIYPFDWPGIFATIISGILVGFERQLFGKPAGMRTSVLITISTYVFVVIGRTLDGDQLRIIGQIVTGVGFLGGGVIISKEGVIQGMTSAATIWLLAAVGTLIGAGYPILGIKLTLVSMAVLWFLNTIERGVKPLQKGVHRIRRNQKTR